MIAIYVTVALVWLIPDRRLEQTLAAAPARNGLVLQVTAERYIIGAAGVGLP